MDPLGATGILVSLAVAGWQYWRAGKAEQRTETLMKGLPAKIASIVRAVLPADNTAEVAASGESSRGWYDVKYADIDGDGSDEILIQFPAGVHGSGLKIFGRRDLDFQEIGDLRSGTPAGFEIGDFDNDGRLEIATEETDWDSGRPYVSAPRLRVVYRWDGKAFSPISRSGAT